MKDNALFLTNITYVEDSSREGGVKLCTRDYLSLIQLLFNVSVFKVKYNIDIYYKIRRKLALNVYGDYRTQKYKEELITTIKEKEIRFVFLNLSNTSKFGDLIKNEFGESVKVILCSHGNESGDFLHEVSRFKRYVPLYRRLFSSFTLGKMLIKEVEYRQKSINLVLTVSPIEESIEKWLGASKVMMVPRTISHEFIKWNPVQGRVGFIADLSHHPNFFGINEVCKHLDQLANNGVELRIVGSPENLAKELEKKYQFVKYAGYLTSTELTNEIESWSLFLNPVFYYSRGVTTKLAKAFGWGLPVITTSIGSRGYIWDEGNPIFAETPFDMAKNIVEYSNDVLKIKAKKEDVLSIVKTMPTLDKIGNDLNKLLLSL